MQIVEEEQEGGKKSHNLNTTNNNDEENRILYSNFIYSLKTEVSRKTYFKYLRYYMKFLGVNTLKDLVGKPQKI